MDSMGTTVLGAGVTGLAVAMASGARVLEQDPVPGGICRSYYCRPGDLVPSDRPPAGDDAYRFEVGGGHWVFGGDEAVLDLLDELAPLDRHERRAAVHLGAIGRKVPYPLQHHAALLGEAIAHQVAAELAAITPPGGEDATLRAWLERSFGRTLCELFFFPFHERYTAGLDRSVAPQDACKSPAAASSGGPPAGYNPTFAYPRGGLDALARALAARCDVEYGRRVTAIDPTGRTLAFADGTAEPFDRLVSTLPLHTTLALAGVEVGEPDPHTAVVVVNLGAVRGPSCPDEHWVYEADSASGFFRCGFYSNVDTGFLPAAHRDDGSRVALYIERAVLPDALPGSDATAAYVAEVTAELAARGWIGEVEVADVSLVPVAYTWRRPGSTWRERAIAALDGIGVTPVGRYGAWRFQGIADSIADGLALGRHLASADPVRR
jgi:protoporphyrinogen oxidase